MESNTCKDCTHYLQHYVLGKTKIFRIYCGHCTYCNVRRRLPDSKACEHFTPAPADEEAFASKEYLSKALLDHVLSLPLLPPIEDLPAATPTDLDRG